MPILLSDAPSEPEQSAAASSRNETTIPISMSGNPSAVNIFAGSGSLGDWLGVNENGFRLGGIQITDANGQATGGNTPGLWSTDSLTILDLSLDLEKSSGIQGGLIGSQFLFYFGEPVNSNAASVMGYNSLDAGPPNDRVEIYQLWYRQQLLEDRLTLRVGKMVPTYDFNNVSRSIHFSDPVYNLPGISGAILTPLYLNPTALGIMPGYYDSAAGCSVAFDLTDQIYVEYGFFDGNLAAGRKTGLSGPRFNGYYVHLAEAGAHWKLGPEDKPGKMGIGGWYQTGRLTAPSGIENGASGIYYFLSQRLYYERPGESPDGLSAYLQLAATNSDFISTHRFLGCGLTYFGPLPTRDHDSMGFAFAYGKMNDDPALGIGSHEAIYTWYYQMELQKNLYFQPNLSYITTPAANPGVGDVFAVTLRVMLMF